jgi:hypothetical protein
MLMLNDPVRYVFDISGALHPRGRGIVNQSRMFPNFIVRPRAFLTLENSASFLSQVAGVRSANIAIQQGGTLTFRNSSNGGDATVANRGTVEFTSSSSAARMRISNQRVDTNLGPRIGRVEFYGQSNGGNASFVNQASAIVTFEKTRGPANNDRVSLGTITNYGSLRLGLNTLIVQSAFNQPEQGRVHMHGRGAAVGNLYVRGHAFLGGELWVVSDPAQPLAPGSYRVLRADGGRNGGFDLVATGLSARLDHIGNEVWLRVQ